MHKSGAQLVRYTLEKLSIQHTFGVLGNHNREIYNELKNSSQIQAHLVNQEFSAAFMADAISRTSSTEAISRTSSTEAIGTMLITADAIVSQGVADAFVSGVPLLIIAGSGAMERDGINSQPLMQPATKACLKISHYKDLVTSLFEAHQIATSNKPGPVYVEIPVDVQMHIEDIDDPLPVHLSAANQSAPDQEQIDGTAQLLIKAKQPALFIG